MKKLLFSVTIKDCDMDTFTVHGHGGGGKDTSRNGCRLTHRASGAVGEGRDHRSLTQNREDAFKRMARTVKFQNWWKIETARKMGKPSVEQLVDKSMHPNNLKVEVRDETGRWTNQNI